MPNLTMDSLDYSLLIIDSKTGLGLSAGSQELCEAAGGGAALVGQTLPYLGHQAGLMASEQ